MYDLNELNGRIELLEDNVKGLKKELRRIKTSIFRLGKLGLGTPNELLLKKEDVEIILKERKQELKLQKKIAELIK